MIAVISLVDCSAMLGHANNKWHGTFADVSEATNSVLVVHAPCGTDRLIITEAFSERCLATLSEGVSSSLGNIDDKRVGTSVGAAGNSDHVGVVDVESLSNVFTLSKTFSKRLALLVAAIDEGLGSLSDVSKTTEGILVVHADGNSNGLTIGQAFSERLAILVEATIDEWHGAFSDVCETIESVLVIHADSHTYRLSITESFGEGSARVSTMIAGLLTSLGNAHNQGNCSSIGTSRDSDDIIVVDVEGLADFLTVSHALCERFLNQSLGNTDDKGIGAGVSTTGDSNDISVVNIESLTNLLAIS
jgi:hypothetical protein